MEKIKQRIQNLPLRKAFAASTFTAMVAALTTSILTIWVCIAVQNYLLPDKEQAVLSLNVESEDGSQSEKMTIILSKGEELPLLISREGAASQEFVSYTFDQIEKSYTSLSPKRQLVYVASGIAMIAMPTLYGISGILLCAAWFYRHKLETPLEVLQQAADQIKEQDLDFTVQYKSRDEMGDLCRSFEQMREALLQANREMWQMLEERQKLQASIAHDLRNPIAILKGYAQYLQLNFPKGNITTEQGRWIANQLEASAERLERYTDSIRNINQLEALELHKKHCQLQTFLKSTAADAKMLFQQSEIQLQIEHCETDKTDAWIDTENYSRILENLLQNARRMADRKVWLSWQIEEGQLTTIIKDDGEGFTEEIVRRKRHTLRQPDGEHMGMGLVVSEILCHKHGGTLKLANAPEGGAIVQFTIQI